MNHSKKIFGTLLTAAMLFGTMVTSVHAADADGPDTSGIEIRTLRLREAANASPSVPVLTIYGNDFLDVNGDWHRAAASSGSETEWEAASYLKSDSEPVSALSSGISPEDGGDFYAEEATPVFPEAVLSPGQVIAATAQEYLGCDYVYGGSSPDGFDCSGFTQYVMALCGYTIGRGAGSQVSNGVPVSEDDLQPGDLVFFSESFTIDDVSHVGLYIGDGQFIHAANAGIGVVISDLNVGWYSARYVGAHRVW